MAANEIAERLAASAWLRVQPDGNAPAAALLSALQFRSMVGFQQSVYTRVNFGSGLALLLLDRELSRRETTVHAWFPYTVSDETRNSYPDQAAVTPQAVLVEPFHFDWIGDPTAPSWLPFGVLGPAVPAGFDLDRYNALALQLADDGNACDYVVTVFEHPRYDGPTVVLNVLPDPA